MSKAFSVIGRLVNGEHIGFIQTFGRSEEAADGDFALMRQLAKLVFGGVNAQFAEAGGHMDGAEEILHSLDAEKGGSSSDRPSSTPMTLCAKRTKRGMQF